VEPYGSVCIRFNKQRHVTQCPVTQCHVTQRHVTQCHFTQRHVMQCHVRHVQL